MRLHSSISLLTLFGLIAQPASAACNMQVATKHIQKDGRVTKILASDSGIPAIYFEADVDVNTDGSPRSYHPLDPRATSLALNNIANAITYASDAKGKAIPRKKGFAPLYVAAFEAARDSDYATVGVPTIRTDEIIPWKKDAATGRKKPCTISSGPYAGYFVSETAYVADASKDECDEGRYLDALSVNAAVLPGKAVWKSQGKQAQLGDLVVIRSPSTGRVAFGVIGDTGPYNLIGEATAAFAAALRGTTIPATATGKDIVKLALASGQYLIFPNTDIRKGHSGAVTQTYIDARAKTLFEAWGGEARLKTCPPN